MIPPRQPSGFEQTSLAPMWVVKRSGWVFFNSLVERVCRLAERLRLLRGSEWQFISAPDGKTNIADLSRFEAEPDKFEPSFESTIKEKAEQDPEFPAELKKRIDEIGPQITMFQKIKKGKDVIGVD